MLDRRAQVRMRTTSVVFEYLTHELGHWCNPCALSTGIRVWVAVHFRTSDGGTAMHLQQRLTCHECGQHDVTVADAGDT